MASWEDVARIAATLPETEGDARGRDWRVRGKPLVWERPLRQQDLDHFAERGEPAPAGDILGARVPDVGVRDALIADDPAVFFITPHFANYPAVLIRLAAIGEPELTEVLTDAWLKQAPKRLAAQYRAQRD
jgi:hypothetical protein